MQRWGAAQTPLSGINSRFVMGQAMACQFTGNGSLRRQRLDMVELLETLPYRFCTAGHTAIV
jgi:hypothetical protein